MDAVQHFLSELDRAKHRAYGVTLDAQTTLEDIARYPADPQRTEAAALTLCLQAERDAINSTLALVSLALALTETQQVQLVRASDATYQEYLAGDLMLIDELSLKTEAFQYIIAPAPAVAAAHEYHRQQLARRVGG